MKILSELKPPVGSKKKRKIVGRGPGSGHGKTSCRGHKGQKARSGVDLPPWFEGGRMPLIRRTPKRGFFNKFGMDYEIVNLNSLNKMSSEIKEITPELLLEKGIVNSSNRIKILGDGNIEKPLYIKTHAISESAKKKIESAGGKVEILK